MGASPDPETFSSVAGTVSFGIPSAFWTIYFARDRFAISRTMAQSRIRRYMNNLAEILKKGSLVGNSTLQFYKTRHFLKKLRTEPISTDRLGLIAHPRSLVGNDPLPGSV